MMDGLDLDYRLIVSYTWVNSYNCPYGWQKQQLKLPHWLLVPFASARERDK